MAESFPQKGSLCPHQSDSTSTGSTCRISIVVFRLTLAEYKSELLEHCYADFVVFDAFDRLECLLKFLLVDAVMD